MIAPAEKPLPKAAPGSLNFGVSLAAAAIVTLGFSFTIVPDLLLRLRPAVLYLHALTAFAWIVLVVVQAGLIRNRKPALHRKIGVYGLWLGAVVSVTAFFTALILRHDSVIRHGDDGQVEQRIAFLAIPLAGFVIFTVTLALAAYWRNRPALHRRCIMLSWTGLMGAGIARIPVIGDIPYAGNAVPIFLILLLCAQDYWRDRRVHPVYLIGLPLAAAMLQTGDYLYGAHPAWWVAAARALIGV